MAKILALSTVLMFYLGCNLSNIRKIQINDSTVAEGVISKDTVYDRKIEFYDSKTGKKVSEGNYSNGLLNGDALTFDNSQRLKVQRYYVDGLIDGDVTYYDTSGNLEQKEFYYAGLSIGPTISYYNNQPKLFQFHSVEGMLFFKIEYDSLFYKDIKAQLDNHFFYCWPKLTQEIESSPLKIHKEYFIYTPNPPKFNFQYDLVAIDSSNKVLSVIKKFNENYPFAKFTLKDTAISKSGGIFAIRLILNDSARYRRDTLFKILN